MLGARATHVLAWTVCSLSILASALVLPARVNEPRKFELSLTLGKGAPDGQEREMIFINGQFPGPILEMNEGEEIHVLVHNKLPYNTSLHFHGIEQRRTPWSDGMPGLSQRQIASGADFTYKWTATQYGSFWYHAHERGQVDDGFLGPLLIHPAEDRARPFDRISNDPTVVAALRKAEASPVALTVGDWRKISSEDAWNVQVASGIEATCFDSIIFNGKGKVDCWPQSKIDALIDDGQRALLRPSGDTTFTAKGCMPADALAQVLAPGEPVNPAAIPPSVFDVCTPSEGSHEVIQVDKSSSPSPSSSNDETWVAIDLISSFSLLSGTFSIDEQSLWLYAVDGAYIEPERVDAINLYNGARYSFFVRLTGEPRDYTIRFASTSLIQLIAGTATLRYADPKAATASTEPSVAHINDAGDAVTDGVVFFDDFNMKMFPADKISQTSDRFFRLDIRVAGQSYLWALNNTIYPMQLDNDEPLLFSPDPYRNNNVTITTLFDEWIDIVFVSNSAPMPPHPMHKHGSPMWHIGHGNGHFPYASVAETVEATPESFNLVDPPRRDTWTTLPAITGPVWLAIRYRADNPGAWFLHCHIQSHTLGGMSLAIQDGIDQWPTVPPEYLNA